MARDKGGNSINQAIPLIANGTLRDQIGGRDRYDFFRFTVRQRSSFSAALSRFSQNTALTLFRNRAAIAQSARLGRRRHQLNATLDPGTYVLRVSAQGGQTNYQLTLASAATFTPPPVLGGGLAPGAIFYSDEFGYERLPPNFYGFNLLYVGFPSIASFFNDEPDYNRALRLQYPSLAEDLTINAIAMGTSREGSDIISGRPDRIFINSRGQRVFIPGYAGYGGYKPPGPQIFTYPNW